jgi:hypothetical protein
MVSFIILLIIHELRGLFRKKDFKCGCAFCSELSKNAFHQLSVHVG